MVQGVKIASKAEVAHSEILADGALEFLAELHRTFNARRLDLLNRRQEGNVPLIKEPYLTSSQKQQASAMTAPG